MLFVIMQLKTKHYHRWSYLRQVLRLCVLNEAQANEVCVVEYVLLLTMSVPLDARA
jgi:hypothetical protein